MLDALDAIVSPLRDAAMNAGAVDKEGYRGLYTYWPDTQAPPYGYIQVTGLSPPPGLREETFQIIQLLWWGEGQYGIDRFAAEIEWLDGHIVPQHGHMLAGRYARQSRSVEAVASNRSIFQLTDLYSCTYVSIRKWQVA